MHGPHDKAQAWLERQIGAPAEAFGPESGAKTLWFEGYREDAGPSAILMFWFPADTNRDDPEDLAMLAHEALHAANFVLSARGMTLSLENDEAYAYYLSWIFSNLYQRLA
jgi:hypothetical protein